MEELMKLFDKALKADKAYKSSAAQELPDKDEKLDALFNVLSEINDIFNCHFSK